MKKILPAIIILFVASCATIGTLGGGKVDDQAPKIVSSNISQLNFNEKKIIIEFNEYIVLNNPEKNISILPRHTTLKFSIHRKKLIISLDSSLKPNTTYNLSINGGITDFNANNQFSYSVIFSTGNSIDSGKISVIVKNFKDYKNMKIALSTNDGSDSFKSFTSDYIFDLNRESIQFDGLKDKRYHVWLFTDENSDQKPDWYKPVNFIKNPELDSTHIIEVQSWPSPFIITKAMSDGKVLKIKYVSGQDYKKSLDQLFTGLNVKYVYRHQDSSIIFLNNDGILSRIDTLIQNVKQINYKDEVKHITMESIRAIKTRNNYTIQFLKIPYYGTPDNNSIESTITIPKLDSFILIPVNDSIQIPDTFRLNKIVPVDYKSLAFLELRIKNKKLYDIIILKDNKPQFKKLNASSFENYLPPGTYQIIIFENKEDHVFNPFKLSPASLKLYQSEITLKASWDEVLDINIE